MVRRYIDRIASIQVPGILKRIAKGIFKATGILLLLIFTILLVRAFDARRLPDLEVWHRVSLDAEFSEDDYHPGFTLQDYLLTEEKVFQELEHEVYEKVEATNKLLYSKYFHEGPNNPLLFSRNWNRTFEMNPMRIKGGVLLLHGMTDSPYSLRRIGEIFREAGFYVLGMRMPGHGTVPAAMKHVTWQDWAAATRVGVKHVAEKARDNGPFYLVGYSNGGALAVKHALDAAEEGDLAMPDRIILFSPAIGVTPLAMFSNWHKVLSFIPYFEKFRWLSIEPEYDPYKYNSFPKNGGDQMHLLTKEIRAQLARIRKKGELSGLPPILTFQSLVDSTVLTRAIVGRLYDHLEENGSEVVLFDINRISTMKDFFIANHQRLLVDLEHNADLPYALTVITNIREDSPRVLVKTKKPGSAYFNTSKLGRSWPSGIYSLSHVAIPFPPDDPMYGRRTGRGKEKIFNLGSVEPRGERGLLRVSIDQLMRLRYNPFFDYIEKRLRDELSNVKRKR